MAVAAAEAAWSTGGAAAAPMRIPNLVPEPYRAANLRLLALLRDLGLPAAAAAAGEPPSAEASLSGRAPSTAEAAAEAATAAEAAEAVQAVRAFEAAEAVESHPLGEAQRQSALADFQQARADVAAAAAAAAAAPSPRRAHPARRQLRLWFTR